MVALGTGSRVLIEDHANLVVTNLQVTFAGRMHEINIAVLGAAGVGKSSFIQRVFDHRAPPTLTVTPRKMSIDGEEYTVRLIELRLEDLDFEDGSRLQWPTTADHRPFPPVDAVLTLYNVMDKESLSLVPETLRERTQTNAYVDRTC